MRSPLQVFLTVDTEASIAGCFDNPLQYPPLLSEPIDGVIDGTSEALGFLLRTLQHYQLTATFFTESLQSRYFGVAPMQKRVVQILEAGQDVQLHVHPCWLNFAEGRLINPTPNDQSTGRPLDELVAIFAEAQQRFGDWGFGAAKAVRTGNFSTGMDTFIACREAGLLFSSNIAVALRPPVDVALHENKYGFQLISGVTELPLTSFRSYRLNGRTADRIMAITACSFAEMVQAIEQAYEQGLQAVCILTHPFEFIARSNLRFERMRANRLNQERFRLLCDFLARNDGKYRCATFGKLDATEIRYTNDAGAQLSGSYPQMLLRTAENISNDHFGR